MPQFPPQTIQVMFYAFALYFCHHIVHDALPAVWWKKKKKIERKGLWEYKTKEKEISGGKMKGEEEEFPLKQSTSFLCFLRKVSTTSFLVLSIITLNIFMNIFVAYSFSIIAGYFISSFCHSSRSFHYTK